MSLSLPVEPVPREKRQWREWASCLADALTSEFGSALQSSPCALTERSLLSTTKKASSASRASDRSPDALGFRGSTSLLDYDRLFSMPTSRGRVLFISRSPPSGISASLAVLKPFDDDLNWVTNKISADVKTNRLSEWATNYSYDCLHTYTQC